MSHKSTLDQINHLPSCIFSSESILENLKVQKCYASPMFQKILLENSHGIPLPDLITKDEMNSNKERVQVLKNLYTYEKQYGVDCDFFHKPDEGLWSVLRRLNAGEDVESR